MLLNLVAKINFTHYYTSLKTPYGYIIMIIVDSCMTWFHFDCIMQQLKKSYHIATNVCSRKSATTFGDLPDWSCWNLGMNPNLLSEKICETSVIIQIPDCWHICWTFSSVSPRHLINKTQQQNLWMFFKVQIFYCINSLHSQEGGAIMT